MILIIGHPNAGKTTYSAQFDNVFHLDDFPLSKFLNCNKAVSKTDGNVVVEGIYNLRCRRERLLEAVKNKKCERVCIWLDVDIEECIRRETRGRTQSVVENDFFEAPTFDEGWDKIIHIKGD